MQNKQAFTLIELLVVVLIIGILAAVAVPQYRISVGKSQYATIKNLTESIAKAEEIYYLANDAYTTDFENLDISMPGGKLDTSTSSNYQYDWGSCWIILNTQQRVNCQNKALKMTYRRFLHHDKNYPNNVVCIIAATTDISDWRNQICRIETNRSRGNVQSEFNQILYHYL